MPYSPKPRLLIFIVAYHAAATLRGVLDRIPTNLFEKFECEILVVDDASTDGTFQEGQDYQRSNANVPLVVLQNEHNQGYGGNQKVGYAYAVERKFDFVALVHGDGQYAPEELPNLLEPLVAGQADAVFGSRMVQTGSALKGGMPLYKYVGNKVLTKIQNTLLKTNLSEFHSGYRLYSVALLARLPLRLNSNDFHFDTEIIIQLLNAGARIIERPIPTYYGNEICRVNGLEYAGNVVRVTMQNVLHRVGLRYQRRFDTEPDSNAHYDLKLGYTSSHSLALDAVPPGSKVLDIGAGPGGLASKLLEKNCSVTVVDQHATQIEPELSERLKVLVQDLNTPSDLDVANHEVLLLLDIIEHLQDPERFIAELRKHFNYDQKTVIVTTPNIAFFVQRVMLVLGQFTYGKAGILDRTHTRLFTFQTLERLLSDEGFRIDEIRGVPAPFPKVLGNGPLGLGALKLNEWLISLSRTLFSYQIYVRARTTPDVSFVLNDTKRRSTPPGPIS